MARLSEVQFAVINIAATGTLVAAQTTGKIRVVSLFLQNTTALSATFKSGAAGTAITGPMALGTLGTLVLPFQPAGWFETAAATLLELSLSAGTQVSGGLQWVAVDN